MKNLSENEKYFKWVGNVTDPKYERNYQVGKLKKMAGRYWSKFSCHRFKGRTIEPKICKFKNFIVGYGRKSSVTVSWGLEILLENTEKSGKIQEVKAVPKITKDIVSDGILLQYGYEMEEDLGIMNVK